MAVAVILIASVVSAFIAAFVPAIRLVHSNIVSAFIAAFVPAIRLVHSNIGTLHSCCAIRLVHSNIVRLMRFS
ncbi:hypothetical protein T484DRAFT_1785378 [Baffinella frigidus]|nr:hypothetical protein T484DRAFT_1785378 [Cryptophyta sp. CCMP2293]